MALVVATFIGWIDRLSRLGRMNETIDRVAAAAAKALDAYAVSPSLGARPARSVPQKARALLSGTTGYLQHVDVSALATLCKDRTIEVDIAVLPGRFVGTSDLLAHVTGASDEDADSVRQAFIVGERRSFDQDPRFGLIVLSEIASRALSPAVNDPGTAIDVLATIARLLTRPIPDEVGEPLPGVYAPSLHPEALLEDSFVPIARDGAGIIEVALRIQRTLAVIARMPRYRAAAHALATQCGERALQTLTYEPDRRRLTAALAVDP